MDEGRTDEERRAALGTLAHARTAALREGLARLADAPAARVLKGPETGLVMIRGRTGGGGAPFNVGEATMTHCVVALPCGTTGFGYVLGREAEKARLVAHLDALGGTASHADAVRRLVGDLASAQVEAATRKAAETAATRVEFFTMAREGGP